MSGRALAALCPLLALAAGAAHAGSFLFSDEDHVDIITHPIGYLGGGGVVEIGVCIDPVSPNAADMRVGVRNAVDTFNALVPTTENLLTGTANDVPYAHFDFESVALHELGHSLGLTHPNLGSESGLSGDARNYTHTTTGNDQSYDLSNGADDVEGSADDARGDDENLHWFRKADNDPFALGTLPPGALAPGATPMGGVVDASTYSRSLAALPPGQAFAANADRAVAQLMGHGATEAVMQQGTMSDEAQRTLAADDVATLRLAMAGLDETQGSADDYTIQLRYEGYGSSCDIVFAFDDTETAFAVSDNTGYFLPDSTHARITSTRIYFNDGFNWFFRPSCGDGWIQTGEECDDGSTTNGDGCSAACAEESGFVCSGEPSACGSAASCGNGQLDPGEDCDASIAGGPCCSATCAFAPAGSPCDDQDACTASDACDGAGSCLGASSLSCDDGEPCTTDSCDPQLGCLAIPHSGPCDDGDACSAGENCSTGTCAGGTPISCDDGDSCTSDSCQAGVGCVFSPLPGSNPCSDGNICTLGDRCEGGSCESGFLVDCDDGDPCTADSCHPVAGCRHELVEAAGCIDLVPASSVLGRLLAAGLLACAGLAALELRTRRLR